MDPLAGYPCQFVGADERDRWPHAHSRARKAITHAVDNVRRLGRRDATPSSYRSTAALLGAHIIGYRASLLIQPLVQAAGGPGQCWRCRSLRFLIRLPQVAMSHQAPARLWERS